MKVPLPAALPLLALLAAAAPPSAAPAGKPADALPTAESLLDAIGPSNNHDHNLTRGDEPDYTRTLETITHQCSSIASELLGVLDEAKASGKHKLTGSLVATLRSIGKERTVRKLEKQLELCLSLIVAYVFGA